MYSAVCALDELREILGVPRAVLVVLDALLGPVDQRHVSRHACPPLCLRTSRPSCAPVNTDVKAGAVCCSVQAARYVMRIEGGGPKSVPGSSPWSGSRWSGRRESNAHCK